jgi:copper transport protein
MRRPRPARLAGLLPAAVAAGLAGLALSVLSVLAVPGAGPAGAHASLVGTAPAPGQRLERPPAEIVLEFSERVSPLRDGVRLVDPQGRPVGGEQATNPPGAPGRVRLPVAAGLRDGTYTVSWRVVSADSHPINGAFAFTVGSGSAAQPDGALAGTDVAGSVVAALWLVRVGGYAGLALLLGGGVFLLACWPAGLTRRRARRIVWAGWGAVLATAVLGLLLQGPYAAGASLARAADPALLADTLRTDYGTFTAARIAILALLALALARLPRLPGRRRLVVPGVLAAALAGTWVGTGHANAGPVAQGIADAAHLIAMSVWVGGLVMLVACVLAIARDGAAPPEAVTAVTRFSRMAMIAVAVLVGTGVVQAWLELGGVAALTGSGYGRLLFAKLAAVGLVL